MVMKYHKCRKIIQINITLSNLRPPKIYPNWDFWFENKPSGNPGLQSAGGTRTGKQIRNPFPVDFAPFPEADKQVNSNCLQNRRRRNKMMDRINIDRYCRIYVLLDFQYHRDILDFPNVLHNNGCKLINFWRIEGSTLSVIFSLLQINNNLSARKRQFFGENIFNILTSVTWNCWHSSHKSAFVTEFGSHYNRRNFFLDLR
jgi:hypothetical protein